MKQPHDSRKVLLKYRGQILAVEVEGDFDDKVQGLVEALQGGFIILILGNECVCGL